MSKRVIFFNPAKQDYFSVNRLHMGFTLIGQILKSHGHEVKIIDYAFLKGMETKLKIPSVEESIDDFNPDVVGVSVFTYLYKENQEMIDRISRHCDVPIILGGPHLTVFPDDFLHDKRISYIVRGEAEKTILDVVSNAKREKTPVVIDCRMPSAGEIPQVNLNIALGAEHLSVYQIQLSRGCPYN